MLYFIYRNLFVLSAIDESLLYLQRWVVVTLVVKECYSSNLTFILVLRETPQETPWWQELWDLNLENTSISFINIIMLCVFFPGIGRKWLFQHLKCLPMAASFMNSYLDTMGSVTLISNRELNLSMKMMSSSWQQTLFATLGRDFFMLLCDCKWGFIRFSGPETITQLEYLTRTLQHLGTI